MSYDFLMNKIHKALSDLEKNGDIVLCSDVPTAVAKKIYDAVIDIVPNNELSPAELSGMRALIFQASRDSRFFDWEMPTLTGFSAEEFRAIAEKLPKH